MQNPADMDSPIPAYARPRTSFLEGLASILDLGGTLARDNVAAEVAEQWAARLTRQGLLNPAAFRDGRLVAPPVSAKSDAETIGGYWSTVGQYMRDAVGEWPGVAPNSPPNAARRRNPDRA